MDTKEAKHKMDDGNHAGDIKEPKKTTKKEYVTETFVDEDGFMGLFFKFFVQFWLLFVLLVWFFILDTKFCLF